MAKNKPRILLLHGWDWRKYPKFKPIHQWENRQVFLDGLQTHFDVDYPAMPGFDPGSTPPHAWTLDDYASWLNERLKSKQYDLVVGYSFGCAVIVRALHSFNISTPALLISPAIARSYAVRPPSVFFSISKALKKMGMEKIHNLLMNLYVTHVARNNYYIHGGEFLRNTYRDIVTVDLSKESEDLLSQSKDVQFIFGEQDTATPHSILFEKVPSAKGKTHIVSGAGHNVGGTHPEEVIGIITKRGL